MGLGPFTSYVVCGLFFAVSAGVAKHTETSDSTLLLLPVPQSLEHRDRSFRITAQTRIILGEKTVSEDLTLAHRVQRELGKLRTVELRLVREESLRKRITNFIFIGPGNADFALELLTHRKLKLPPLREEGYFLDVRSDGILVIANSPRGRFYAATSLLHLIRQERRATVVPEVTIHDGPQFRIRGIIEDVPPELIPTLAYMKNLLNFLASYKLNTYVLPFSVVDDRTSAASLDETGMRTLQSFAKEQHIEVIPRLNAFDLLRVRNLDEGVAPVGRVFSSSYVYVERIGEVSPEDRTRIMTALQKYKKKPVVDLRTDEDTHLLPEQAIIVIRQNPLPGSRFNELRQRKVSFVVSIPPVGEAAPFPHTFSSRSTLQEQARIAAAHSATGLLVSGWSNGAHGGLPVFNIYGYAWAAQYGWNQSAVNRPAFDRKLLVDMFLSDEEARLASIGMLLLSQADNRVGWSELWHNPTDSVSLSLLNRRRIENIESSMSFFLHEVSRVSYPTDHSLFSIEAFAHVARLHLWFADKLDVSETLQEIPKAPDSARRDSVIRHCIRATSHLLLRLRRLRDEFQALWLKTNRQEGLPVVLKPFDQEIVRWEKMIDELRTDSSGKYR